ncbi:O-fucosyltransferase family protein [Dorcoceras hygrometricum]|uniref:O-fucosyltransferase family protein n=1 Tax=Dorcoceras hygrometricum TaxID=472368 RepID=A0A2Z7CRY1_9LAMI|nr:O-fucosyltransferase family protein [Dorcoceras hygrometricum]
MKKKHRQPWIGVRQVLHTLIVHHRRHDHGHSHRLFPLLSAATGCLLLLFALVSFLSPPLSINHRPHVSLIDTSMNGGEIGRELWSSKQSGLFYGCNNASRDFITAEMNTEPNRYLLIETSGGLNQQRTGITDAVVAAYILNAHLVVPKLDQKSFWNDTSNFSDIFDVAWFKKSLSKDVKIIQELPQEAGKVVTMRVPRKCDPECYRARILPKFNEKHVQAVQLTKFDYRLSNRLDVDLQKLRCRVNYHSLRYTDPILEMGRKLTERMRMKSQHFVALHLRYEPDMLAFSGCYYGGGEKEVKELGAIRKRWPTLHAKDPDKERSNGKCPLSPEEVGLMLRALGFGSDVHIYIASGAIYGGDETLAPLKALFPNLYTKESLARNDELAEFSPFSSRMAALDYIVCDKSDVFVANNNGNMARILAGSRRYFGHKQTIRPNVRKLNRLFRDRHRMGWDEFASGVRKSQVGFMGEPDEVKPGKGVVFHENPQPCICEKYSETRENVYNVGRDRDELLWEDEQVSPADMSFNEYISGL